MNMSVLPTPPYKTKNPPSWFASLQANQQDKLDLEYLHSPVDTMFGPSVDTFNAAAKDWITNQTIARNSSPDPANFAPAPFTRPVPRRAAYDIAEDGFTIDTWEMDADPNIHPPVLPPYVAPAKPTIGGGFVTTAATVANDEAQWKAAVMGSLSQISLKLSQLLAGK
jgi:hypothetical protein